MKIATIATNISPLSLLATAGIATVTLGTAPVTAAVMFDPSDTAITNFASSASLASVDMTIAYDGTDYWSVSGNFPSGVRLAQYDGAGNVLTNYSPGIDFRSIFTDSAGNVYARQFNDSTIYEQTSPGVFAPSGVSLMGGTLNAQSSVVFNGAGTEYVAMEGGTVSRWDLGGNFIGTVTLSGFGSDPNENISPQNRVIAAVGDYWLTYNSDNGGTLSAWDQSGNRVAQTILVDAGSDNSDWTLSYANNQVFIGDQTNWRGYDVGPFPSASTPEADSLVGLLALGLLGILRLKRTSFTSKK